MAAASRLRWVVLALVFTASAINYADRQIIALLKPVLEADLGWTNSDYAGIIEKFQLATACSLMAAGWFVDRVGVRRGYAWGVGVWSLAAMAHGLAYTIGQFTGARVVLAVAETVNTPAAIKTTTAWFPAKERSLAMGIVNSAPNLGAIFVPLLVPALALALGWRAAFLITGGIGFVWLAAWLVMGRRSDAVEEEGAVDVAAVEGAPTPWLSLLADRRTWAVAGAKFLTDMGWWFLLFWGPDFFHRQFGLGLDRLGPPLAIVYGLAACGSFAGGYIASRLLAAGVNVNLARKGVMLGGALLVAPIPLVLGAQSYWVAALVLGIALAGHQAFSTNIFAFTADVFPAKVIGAVIGIGATAGTLGGLGIQTFTGWTLDNGGGYLPMFAVVAGAYLLALAWIHLLVPRITPAD
ncbi:MFS transporter [Phenylobacterium sp.]|uniref:MFS transporter n=1 Tax=Phenylobacterium sp. TaxID=1871053 RepID=UPI003BAD5BCC